MIVSVYVGGDSEKTHGGCESMTLSLLENPGQIVAFPLVNRTGMVRRCAAELETKHGDDAVRYWRQQCRQLADHLLALGCSDEDMREQVRDFQDAVQGEMMRRSWNDQSAEA